MKSKKLYYMAVGGFLLWLSLIFVFSAQPVTRSVGLSRQVGQKLSEWFVPGFDKLQTEEQNAFVEKIDFGIRKTAHFLEYMILGIWWFLLIRPSGWTYGKRMMSGIVASALCAVGDEVHQLFVPGRTGRWQDVCIDTAGAAVGIFLLVCICRIVGRRKKKK